MARLSVLIALFLCFSSLPLLAHADEKEDLWQGSLSAGGIKLRMVFHLIKGAEGKYTGVADSPDQGAKGLPLSVKTYDKETLRIEMPTIGGSFEGKLSKDGQQAVGTWRQGGNELPLTLTKGGKLIEIRRPQTPHAPFPYTSEEVTFDSKPGVKLAGTLTLPRNAAKPVPTAVLIAGSGPNNRNESILNHEVFLVLADYLTRHGFGVLRYDKRGIGASKGSYMEATTADFADDADAAVAYLKTRKEVNGTNIGLIGHSEGGVVAPMVAARNRNVAFIVLMAGTGLNGEQILYRQTALIARAAGATEETVAKNRKIQEKMFAAARQDKDPIAGKKRVRETVDAFWTELTEAERVALKSKSPLYAQGDALVSPWMQYFLTYDPLPALQKVTCPVLAMNGSQDLQVPAKEDLSAIESALKAGGNKDYTIVELPGLNHLFQTCTTGSPTEYGDIEETMAPVALRTISDWIAIHTKK
jgi:pimeloyl-ACP methyl ester carboxylesterase